MNTISVIYRSIDTLKPYANNPRENKEAVNPVKNSIKAFGFKVPIIIDPDGVVIAGHTRLLAAKELRIKRVPCVVADDLSEDAVKAFRLADNKVSEFSNWNYDLLDREIDAIDLDMVDFGFDVDFEFSEDIQIDDDDDEVQDNERTRTNDAYNLGFVDKNDCEGAFEMPRLAPCHHIPNDLIGFNYMLSEKRRDVGVHFYIDDYQFERIWNQPDLYIEKLSEFDCALTPDFSLYLDMPLAMKIWNVFRSRLIGQMLQSAGMRVIPTVSWAEPATFNWCFDGLPKNATLSVSTVGVKRSKEAMVAWRAGMDAMIERLSPKYILVYGNPIDYDYGRIKVTYFKNHVTERMNALSSGECI